MSPVILWFRRNLRLHDNLALHAAVDSGRPILPVYISDELDKGGASRWWLHYSLSGLDEALREYGSGLVVRAGSPEKVLPRIAREAAAEAIYFSRRYEPQARAQQRNLAKALEDTCEIHGYDDALIRHPESVMTQSGTPYKVFTPFWKAASGPGEPEQPVSIPVDLETTAAGLDPGNIDALSLLPTGPDWADGLREAWAPGEGRSAGSCLRNCRRLCRTARPPGYRRHVAAVTTSAFWRIEPPAGLARHTFSHSGQGSERR
jgi:deoxyribodipyrimidine photo-lyase